MYPTRPILRAPRPWVQVRTVRFSEFADSLASTPSTADERYFHDDLAALASSDLRRERKRLQYAMLFADRPSPWAIERCQRIAGELKARRARRAARGVL